LTPLERHAQGNDVPLKRKNGHVFLFSESVRSKPMSAQNYVGVNILSKRNRKHVEQPMLIRYADDVRHLTQDEILLAEKRGSEEDDLWVTLPT
jgi:hypothetical protein